MRSVEVSVAGKKMSKATAEFLEEIEREERKMRRQKKPSRRRRKLPDAIARVGGDVGPRVG